MELRVIKGLLASLFLHILFVSLPSFLPKEPNPFSILSQKDTVEIEIVDSSKNKERQIVREAPVPEKMKTESSEDPLSFLSNQDQRVKKQMRAPNIGMTANRGGESETTKSLANKYKKLFEVSKTPSSARDEVNVKPAQEKSDDSNSSLFNMPRGVSTTGESLPREVEVGSFTALNTDRYLYYSFYARVEELIRYPWENAVRWTLETTPRAAFQSNVQRNWITHVDIVLKPNGEFKSALLLKESGVRGFDRAAVQAFANAKLFPNPPQELIEGDGYIHLRYRFNVYVDPRLIGRQ